MTADCRETQLISAWHTANQRCLSAELAVFKGILERHMAPQESRTEADRNLAALDERLHEIAVSMPSPSALDMLCRSFGLSSFERRVLLLSAGVELDSGFAALCDRAQGGLSRPYPTFSLALAALPDAHWSAITPDSPLRRWHLLELVPGDSLTSSPLRIDERVLHYLVGIQHLDEHLNGLVETIEGRIDLAPSHKAVAVNISHIWSRSISSSKLPVFQLCGDDEATKRAIAMAACSSLGISLRVMAAKAMPSDGSDLHALMRFWEREAILGQSALLLECDDVDASDVQVERGIRSIVEGARYPLIISSRKRWHSLYRTVITFEVQKPTADEQQAMWKTTMGSVNAGLNGQADILASQFNLSAQSIRSICSEVLEQEGADCTDRKAAGQEESGEIEDRLWNLCRSQSRPHLDDLAQRIEPAAGWEDLVLPEQQRLLLRDIAAHVRHRSQVYDSWGFARKSSRGLGISALFTGASGTGKTMAAEILAGELNLDLYRIDLSSVVSKYIGETEKNLRKVFDAAEAGGAILLFDEADALFGKRSEVKDSHDRYANIEVSYLLQRMEAYLGLAILTTNMKNALDTAFMRRIRFVVQFPFPDAVQRAEIWRRVFPQTAPTDDLDFDKLACLNISGGNIRNIALSAAFLAVDQCQPIGMDHLLHAARAEYAKMEKPMTEAEIGGWI